jgi:hypothetical protein
MFFSVTVMSRELGLALPVRIQAETSPGGVGISQTVYEAVRSYLPLQPIEIGQRQFEGIEEPMPRVPTYPLDTRLLKEVGYLAFTNHYAHRTKSIL